MEALRERDGTLLEEELFSDVAFVIGEERIKAHKNILSASSSVFKSMLIEENEKDEFHIQDISHSTFKAFLRFIYTYELPELNDNNWASLLYASEKYKIDSLKKECMEFVDNNCTLDNACEFFNEARKNQVDNLVPQVKKTVVYNADKSLSSDSFLEIEDSESLKDILSDDKLDCDESLVYRSALKWASTRIKKRGEEESGADLRKVLGPAFLSIRFPTISKDEFYDDVIPKDILTDEEILCIVKRKKESSPFNWDSRIRISNDSAPILSNSHSIQFQVDCKVKLHSFSIFKPTEKDLNSITGRILLKDEENSILGDESFEIDYETMPDIYFISFSNPIIVNPNTLYISKIEYNSLTVETEGVNSTSTIDGVKWKFKNVDQEHIPWIRFSKM